MTYDGILDHLGHSQILPNLLKFNEYYETIFEWFSKLEEIFGFDLEGYSKIRVYGFLSERFLPYWFLKNSNCIEWPISFKDLNTQSV